ncbi:MAG: hypothetical protein IKB04_07320 [Clostridia bacterium]|nr:hypothetical protein [Clostridia bacterium]
MFGYIKPYQPELKMGEFEQYRGLYCSLCRRLGKRYGCTAQMTLSYDMTFLLLLYLALSDDCTGFHKGRCPYNPFKKRLCCGDSPQLDRCADASVLLVYYKTLDNVADSAFVKRTAAKAALIAARRQRRRALRYEPEMDKAMAAYTAAQAAVEQAHSASVDAAAEPTAKLLSFLCALPAKTENERRVLDRLGYCLGRWIYLMDAADDVEQDSRTGNYNPLLEPHRGEPITPALLADCRERVRFSLNASLAECKAAYELLEIRRYDGILRNILEYGMAAAQRSVLSGGTEPQEVKS